MVRNRIVYIPYPVKGSRINEYTLNTVNVLKKDYEVVGVMTALTDFWGMLKTKAVILNWVESELDKNMKRQILLHKMFGVKIIWVFHNKQPHEIDDADKIRNNLLWLANSCDVILLHSKHSIKFIPNIEHNKRKALYVPHIMYNEKGGEKNITDIREKYKINEKDFVFMIFGLIRPYKNIEGGIKVFNGLNEPNAKLLIVGQPQSNKYAKIISDLCKDNPNIVLDLKFVSTEELTSIIELSDVILLPYKDVSSMNSGVMIQAFSQSRTVIAPDICMARDYYKYGFMYMYHKDLEGAMKKAYRNGKEKNKDMGKHAYKFMQKNNNGKVVKECFDKMLN